jgi:hypothetical protein
MKLSKTSAAIGVAILAACSGGGGTDQVTNPTVQQEVITPPGATFTCTPVELSVGEVRAALPGSNVCIKASAASEYVLTGFFGSTTGSANTSVTVSGFGITTGAGSGGASTSLAPVMMTTLTGQTPRQSLELAFRNYEKNVLAPRMAGARAAYRNRATFATVPATVGSAVTLNGSETACSDPNNRSAHVVAVSNRAIVVADDANPSGGFTNAEYASIATTFDTLVDPLDRNAFGDPTDIDGNGRVILFYTRTVNELTPAKSEGVIEGFFNPRDLFPTQSTATLQGCAGSNFAEMFYLIVPDPTGTINGNVRTKTDVTQSSISVVAHEYQHLINASRRLYITDANDFEEVWLNEGLSHIAEELLFYRTAGLQPRANIDATAITASQARVDAFNQHQTGNFGRYLVFLQRPEQSTPYADDDSLSDRGAIWSFLRYAADRRASTDGTTWKDLVNAPNIGMANLSQVFGSDVMSWFRDWSIAVIADDKVTTASQYQQPSWNFRSIYPRLGVTTFPLKVRPLSNSNGTTVTLVGGGSMYGTFGIQAGATAGLSWSSGSSSVVFSVLRTR